MFHKSRLRLINIFKTDTAGVKTIRWFLTMYNFIFNKRSILKVIAATVAITSPFSLFAEDSKTDDKTIVITANRTAQDINDTLAAVEIITRKDIERIQPRSITELLASVAGFDLVYNGGSGQNSSLFTRGTSSDHTLVLVDGIRVGSATLGKKTFSTIPVSQIERIEIVKGPRASLWGSDAIGGVIQIFTRRLQSGESSFEATIGSDEFLSSNFSIGFGNDKITNTVTVSYEDSEGYDVFDDSTATTPDSEDDNDGYQRISAAIRGDYTLSANTNLDWVLQFDQGENSFDNAFGANENEYSNHLWNIRYTYAVDQWLTEFSVKQSRDNSFSYDSRASSKVGSTFETRRNQVSVLTQYELNDSTIISGGIDSFNDDIGDSKVRQFDGSFADFAETDRTSNAIFISTVINAGKFIGEASVRYDDIEAVGSEKTFNFSAGYKVLDNVTIAASRAKGFKAPTFNDLYYPNFGSADLVSETSYNTEFLIRANWEDQSLVFVNFDNKVDQLITFVFNPVTFAYLPINVDKANLKGHELVYNVQLGNLSHKLSASYVDAIDVLKSEQLLRRAKEHYSYEIVADLGDLSFFTQFNYSGRRRDNDFSTFPSTPVYLKSHVTVNLGATYRANEKLSFKFKVSDYTDANQSTVFNYTAPGRQVSLSIQYNNF